jgi:hypothetical protein
MAPGVRLGTEPESNTMRTYVAEINGEALIAFRAKGDDEAHDIINEKNGDLQLLIVAALKTAKHTRASALEAYPIDTSAAKSTSNTFTGTAAAFTRAGFKEVARRASARPIMRHDLKAIPR